VKVKITTAATLWKTVAGTIAGTIVGTVLFFHPLQRLLAQSSPGANQTITLLSDVQEANSKTGIVTATGNVQVFYPARGITGTSTQAQYFSRERRIVMTGDVYIIQEGGNSIRGEVVTYLVDEERFIALPQAPQQVESIYVIQGAAEEPEPEPTASNPDNSVEPSPSARAAQPELIPDLPL
jgi:lipopolysaccharide export system protein LptA